MPTIGVHADAERLQKRWILGALGIAFVFHLVVAWAMGWYKLPGLEIPFSHSKPVGPFTVGRIEINPDALKAPPENPIEKLPSAELPKNPSDFNLDANLVEKALQTPQPALATPSVPEPGKVIAAADLSQGLPMVESDSAKLTAEIAKVDPATSSGSVTTSKLAQEIISSSAQPDAQALTAGAPPASNSTTGKLPGFAELAPGFKVPGATISDLPEPILLRLPSDVLFDFDSAQLKPEADALLGQAVGMITKYPQADIHIDGYSDSVGKPDYNATLSQQRAQAVAAWFEQRVAQTGYRFKSQGHGSTNFIVPSTGSIEAQQPNRRVEILIQAQK